MQTIKLRLYTSEDYPLHDPSHVDDVFVPDEITGVEEMARYIESRGESGMVPKFVFIHPTSGAIIVRRTKEGILYNSLSF